MSLRQDYRNRMTTIEKAIEHFQDYWIHYIFTIVIAVALFLLGSCACNFIIEKQERCDKAYERIMSIPNPTQKDWFIYDKECSSCGSHKSSHNNGGMMIPNGNGGFDYY